MIVFGYRNPSSGFVRATVCLLLGAALVMWPHLSVNLAVQVIGGFVAFVGLVSVLLSFRASREASAYMAASLSSALITVLFGVLLLVYPGFFAKVLMFLVGLVLFVFGVGQVVILGGARQYVSVPVLSYVLALLSAAAGIVIIFNPFESVETVMIFMGAAIFVYGVSSMIAAFKMRKAVKAFQKANAPAPDLETDAEGFSSYEDVSSPRRDDEV